MSEPHGLKLLIDKYAELSGKLEGLDMEARVTRAALGHLEASIRLLNGSYDVSEIRPKHPYKFNPFLKRGTYARVGVDILREAGEPLPAREIIRLAIEKQGVKDPDDKTVNQTVRAMESALMKKVMKGVLTVDRSVFPKNFSL